MQFVAPSGETPEVMQRDAVRSLEIQRQRAARRDLSKLGKQIKQEANDAAAASSASHAVDIDQFFDSVNHPPRELAAADAGEFGMSRDYVAMLRAMKSEVVKREETYDAAGGAARDAPEREALQSVQMEECSMAYCADFLREPKGAEYGERPCRRGQMCVFMLMAIRYPDSVSKVSTEEGFVCREFLLPSEKKALDDSNGVRFPTAVAGLCLGCNRFLTTYWYFSKMSAGEEPAELLQNHCNPIEREGEYAASRCLYPNPDESRWTGIARPIVRFAPNTFTYVRVNIVGERTGTAWRLKGARETHVAYFRPTPVAGSLE